ncbi:unnamed protein product [Ixodes pacificus]
MISRGGGGGGGGATALFKVDSRTGEMIPLVVAAGGGGHSAAAAASGDGSDVAVQGRGFQDPQSPGNGLSAPEGKGPGGGGGWNDSSAEPNAADEPTAGRALSDGAAGGAVCADAAPWNAAGGFGGGGGGCAGGGGGGGWKGGDAAISDHAQRSGHGGTSFVHPSRLEAASLPTACKGFGDAMVVMVSAADAQCPCRQMCLARTLSPASFKCACPRGFRLARDGLSCLGNFNQSYYRSQGRKAGYSAPPIFHTRVFTDSLNSQRSTKLPSSLSPEPLGNNPEVQLSRLRQATGMVTEYNPNYEFGGSTCTLQDLNDIPRENLTLVKALGQGAFGEVYQVRPFSTMVAWNASLTGAVYHLYTSTSDLGIETRTPMGSRKPQISHTEATFAMSFFGILLSRIKRRKFAQLEIGREHCLRFRPLLMCFLFLLLPQVCHHALFSWQCYLPSRFKSRVSKPRPASKLGPQIPSDRPAAGCGTPRRQRHSRSLVLSTSTSSAFGSLPNTSGALSGHEGTKGRRAFPWQVTSGGRLEPPANCPGPVYHVMTQCWHATPEERPTFGTILERLGYCLQDPDVTSAPLPVFHRPPSRERDTTVMRPPNPDNVCLQVVPPPLPEGRPNSHPRADGASQSDVK